MNVNDVKIAAEDIVKSGTASPSEGVFVEGIHGSELIDGFDVVETEGFSGVYVLDSSGSPAVSSRVVSELIEENKALIDAISWSVSCSGCSNRLAEEWEIVRGSFVCRECIEYGGDSE